MRTFISSLRPDGSFLGRLESLVHASAWDIADDGEIINSRWKSMRIFRTIPLGPSLDDAPARWATTKYRNHFTAIVAQRLKSASSVLQKARTQEKQYRAQREVYLLEHFLNTASTQIMICEEDQDHHVPFRHLRTPPFEGAEKILPKGFLTKYGYSAQLRRYQYHFLEGSNVSNETVPIDVLQKARMYALDFETHDWKTIRLGEELRGIPVAELRLRLLAEYEKNGREKENALVDMLTESECIRRLESIANANRDERITVASYVSVDQQNYLITTFPYQKTKIQVSVPGSDVNIPFDVIVENNQEDLMRTLSELCAMTNPFIITGHNHLKFDYRKANELAGGFTPGINKEKPIQASQAGNGFVVRTEIPGRESIDLSGFAQHHMHTRNNKLDTVLEDLTGIVEKKDMTHEELFALSNQAENGDQKAIEKILLYAGADGMKSILNARTVLREHILLSQVHNSSFARIDTTSKKTLGFEYHANRRVVLGRARERNLDTQGVRNDEMPFHEFDILDEMPVSPRGWRTRHGMVEAHLIALFPYAKAFEPLLSQDPNISALYQEVRSAPPKKKIRLLRAITALSEYPLFRLMSHRSVSAKEFAEEFGTLPDGKDLYASRVNASLTLAQNFFAQQDLVNYHRDLFLVEGKEFSGTIPGGVDLGKGVFFSGDLGCFGGMIDGQLILRGIADPKSNKGERCRFERTFCAEFIQRLVGGTQEDALQYASEQIRRFQAQEIPPSDVGFERTASRHYTQYSARAKGNALTHMIQSQSQAGDVVRYEYPTERLMVKFFGAPNGRHWGTLSRLVGWAFPLSKRDSRAPLFEAMYNGKGSDLVIEEMVASPQLQRSLF